MGSDSREILQKLQETISELKTERGKGFKAILTPKEANPPRIVSEEEDLDPIPRSELALVIEKLSSIDREAALFLNPISRLLVDVTGKTALYSVMEVLKLYGFCGGKNELQSSRTEVVKEDGETIRRPFMNERRRKEFLVEDIPLIIEKINHYAEHTV